MVIALFEHVNLYFFLFLSLYHPRYTGKNHGWNGLQGRRLLEVIWCEDDKKTERLVTRDVPGRREGGGKELVRMRRVRGRKKVNVCVCVCSPWARHKVRVRKKSFSNGAWRMCVCARACVTNNEGSRESREEEERRKGRQLNRHKLSLEEGELYMCDNDDKKKQTTIEKKGEEQRRLDGSLADDTNKEERAKRDRRRKQNDAY